MPVSIRLAWLLVCSLTALGSAARAADGGNRLHGGRPGAAEAHYRSAALPGRPQVAFVQRETDMDANKGRTSLWRLDLTPGTAPPRRLTDVKANDSSPRWSPDSRTLYFLSTRSGARRCGAWRSAAATRSASRLSLDVGALKLSPRGTCSPSPWKCSRTAPR